MASDFKQQVSPRRAAEVLAAVALLLWRLYEALLHTRWTDWLLLLSLYWLFSIFAKDKRVVTAGTLVFVAGLMAIYLSGQLPLVIPSQP